MHSASSRALVSCVCAGLMLGVCYRDASAEPSGRGEDHAVGTSMSLVMQTLEIAPGLDEVPWARYVRETGSREERPAGLGPLYVSLAALQVLDVHSTLAGIGEGLTEANPVLAPLTREPALLIGTKTALAVTAVALSEKLWRRHRTAAIVLMVAVNVAHAAAVAHNYRKLTR